MDAARPAVDPQRPFLSLLRYNRRYWRAYLLGAVLAIAFTFTELATPMVIRSMVDHFGAGEITGRSLAEYFVLLIAIGVATGLALYWERSILIRASRRFEYDLRNDYFNHVQTLSQDFFHRVKTGDIMARATNDMNYVRMLIGPGIMGSVNMMRLPVTLALMAYLSPWLTLVALLPLPVVSILVYGLVMYMHRQSKRVQERFSDVTSRAQESLSGARVVKAFASSENEIRDFGDLSRRYMREGLKLNVAAALLWPFIGFIVGLTSLLVLWQGGMMKIQGHITLGDLTAFMVYLFMLAWPLAEFGWIMTLYQRGAVSMNRISEILCEVPSIHDTPSTRRDITRIKGAIRFDEVAFAYADVPVLQDICLEVPAGETLAIVGPTGCGKSTLAALIAREYDPTSGRVLIDDVDAREIPVALLRSSIGYVPQDTFLFSDTIRENVTFGRPTATDEEIRRACEIAQFQETVDGLAKGFDTLLGERGINLSGGQKQRLAIARAVLRDAPILILDDALSAVDTHTEERILLGLREVTRSRTSILISHRVSTIRHAHQIIVLDGGRIVERGTHDSLVQLGGLYAEMYRRQLLEDALESEDGVETER